MKIAVPAGTGARLVVISSLANAICHQAQANLTSASRRTDDLGHNVARWRQVQDHHLANRLRDHVDAVVAIIRTWDGPSSRQSTGHPNADYVNVVLEQEFV